MGNVLLLVHRLPYPPNKGDKVRSYHLLKHLAQNNRVFLGTFIDDPADNIHQPIVRSLCADMFAGQLVPSVQKALSLLALLSGQALSLRYYQDNRLQDWVQSVASQNQMDAVVVFSSAMGQFVPTDLKSPLLVDFVDVDSAKWAGYADKHPWPLSWLYRREGKKLLAYERGLAMRSTRSFFVTENEAQLFRNRAPECDKRIAVISNGVDSDYFSPATGRANPLRKGQISVVFTGAMDYWPNVDAVTWFVSDVLPALRTTYTNLCFYIVGRSPTAAVLALAASDVVVTGTVDDVRPYLQHASVVVAPLRLARGIQNKILEAMAMARPVVAANTCVQVIDAIAGEEVLGAESAQDFVSQIERLLNSPVLADHVGLAGRRRVVQNYSWDAHLGKIDQHLTPAHQRMDCADA